MRRLVRLVPSAHVAKDIVAAGGFPQHRANVLAGMPDVRDAAPHVVRSLAKVVRNATAARPADRCATAAEFDAALGALPSAAWGFRPVEPHPGHDRCWEARRLGDGHPVDVCASGAATGEHEVEVRHQGSGNRVKGPCGNAKDE